MKTIVLDATNKTLALQVDIGMQAIDVPSVVVTYADTTDTTMTEGSNALQLSTTNRTTILSAPASSTRRVVKSINIFNNDGASKIFTLSLVVNSTAYIITQVTVPSFGTWSSDDQTGANVTGAITDGSKGDITVSGSGSAWAINNNVVTYAKMQTVTTDRLLGRDTAGTGNVEEIAISGGLEFTNTQNIQVSAFSGDVSKPAGSTTTTIVNGSVSTSKLGGDITTAGKALLDDADASAQRTTLGLGTIATQAANNVSISGGSITGITDLAVADGGTGASTASGARSNLLPSYTSNGGKVLAVNTGTTDVEWITASGDPLTNTNISPTTANQTAAVNTRYFATIAGLTANRDFILPTPAVGNQVELNIVDGDDTYAFIIKGASGVTINGGTAATEWSRLFIKGETVRFVANTTSNWQVVADARIPQKCELEKTTGTTAQSIGNNISAGEKVTLSTSVSDNASIGNTSTYVITPRRTGSYLISTSGRLDTAGTTGTWQTYVIDNAGTPNVLVLDNRYTVGGFPASNNSAVVTLTAGTPYQLQAYQNTGASRNIYMSSGNRIFMSFTEVL